MADLVTPARESNPGPDPSGSHREADTDRRLVEDLWHSVCDIYCGVEVASRHAFNDFELREEDLGTFAAIADLRREHDALAAGPDLAADDAHLLADVDQRLSSLEGRVEILQLATT
jgi:hypothetical protein